MKGNKMNKMLTYKYKGYTITAEISAMVDIIFNDKDFIPSDTVDNYRPQEYYQYVAINETTDDYILHDWGDLQEVIALNGYKELYETELEYLKLLNAKE